MGVGVKLSDEMAGVCFFVVDDDFLIRQTIEHALEDAGFLFLTASDGDEGLQLFADRGEDCRALVTDVNLGGNISGWAVARAAREKFPTLPVVYVTADSSEQWAAHGVPDSILITKPFAPVQIVNAVAELLNKQPA